MKKRYRVELLRTAYMSATLEVRAENEKEARELARESVKDTDWTTLDAEEIPGDVVEV